MSEETNETSALSQDKPSTDTSENLVFGHKISGGDFVGLGFINTLLGIVTLTLYRFWARTNVRKQIWRSVYMNNEPFEYTGTGGELFKGFLIATAVITVPYLIIIFSAQMMPPLIGGIIIFAFVLFIYLIIGAAIWLAFRYLASRTVWRGIRFSLKGHPKDFSLMYFGQLMLNLITIGWWSPKMEITIAKWLWGEMYYGDLPFNFDEQRAKDAKLYPLFALGWAILIIGEITLVSLFAADFMAFESSMKSGNPEDIMHGLNLIGLIYLSLFGFLALVLIAFMPYRAAMMRAIASCISLDGATFRLEVTWLQLLGLWFVNTLILVFSFGILAPVAQARAARFIIEHLKADGQVNFAMAEQGEAGPNQAEGLSDAFDIGII
ncbi:MAG: hypothetical protein FD163_1070 [Hyphomonadaceae bacterium]|nr:MAG: hypothetical protein FD163_1070 [Hyphomonadaceae bacterium]